MKNIIKKCSLLILISLLCFGIIGCEKENPPTECLEHVDVNNDGLCDICGIQVIKPNPPQPPVVDVAVGIEGSSEVKSGQSINLKAVVTGGNDKTVTWEMKQGGEYASISSNGVLTANEVNGDKIIEVIARSNENTSAYASKIITIVTKPTLTQAMLEQLQINEISFEGYINIALYTIDHWFPKLYSTYTTVVKTSMDGTNWYAEYVNGDTNTTMGIYYKNNNGIASQIGVSFMNEEEYIPLLNDNEQQVSWVDSGLYNNFKDLKVSDFTFNEEIWRYEYTGSDKDIISRMIASANPYNFIPKGFSLIIEENEILGIYAISEDDYNIVSNYRAIQELIVAVNYGETVDVPKISKYAHDPIHDDLAVAIENMQNLNSYVLEFKEITASYLTTGYTQSGYREIITDKDCYFVPFSVSYDLYGNEVHNYQEEGSYGYQKVRDDLYNTYINTGTSYVASRAYKEEFNKAKPSFGFAAEIFTKYWIDEEEGTKTYYVDELMSPVASTFYYGVGNDINLYGIFATTGYISQTDSFTPYVVVKDGYITEACFYFYIGSVYGVVELKYSDFDQATIPDDINIEFETREVPTSWSELTIEVSNDNNSTTDDYSVNALDYLKQFYENENIDQELPFFGVPLGDTYGFGLTTIHLPFGAGTAKQSIVFYYDVPLGIDYTIDAPLREVRQYLISLGFVENAHGEFNKDDIWIAPTDSSLDLVIYVWKS